MASSYRGVFCTKRSKGVFGTQSYIQDGAFVNKLAALQKSQVPSDWGLNMPPSAKVCENATKQILHKFVSLTSYSKPIPNFNHL